jgi:putative FmdB family regulatory protein
MCVKPRRKKFMPSYTYKCDCGEVAEVTHSIFDDSVRLCNACSQEMKKKLSPPAVTFNGSGFYSTDK